MFLDAIPLRFDGGRNSRRVWDSELLMSSSRFATNHLDYLVLVLAVGGKHLIQLHEGEWVLLLRLDQGLNRVRLTLDACILVQLSLLNLGWAIFRWTVALLDGVSHLFLIAVQSVCEVDDRWVIRASSSGHHIGCNL